MVDSINGLNGVNKIKTPELKATAANPQELGGFGFGFPPNNNNSGTTVEREIPGLPELENTFADVDLQAYEKNVDQLEIGDKDFKHMNDYYTDKPLCEV